MTIPRNRQLFVLLAVSGMPAFITWLYFFAFPGSGTTAALYTLNKVLEIVFPVIWVRFVLGEKIRLGRPTARWLFSAAVFGLVSMAFMLGLYHGWLKNSAWLDGVPETVFAKLVEFGAGTPIRFTAFITFVVIGNSALEEYFWRWFIFGRLRRLIGLRWALIISSVAFMFHHMVVLASFLGLEHFWTAVLFFSACTGLGAAVWAWMYGRSDALVVPWISHLLADIPILIVGFDLLASHWV